MAAGREGIFKKRVMYFSLWLPFHATVAGNYCCLNSYPIRGKEKSGTLQAARSEHSAPFNRLGWSKSEDPLESCGYQLLTPKIPCMGRRDLPIPAKAAKSRFFGDFLFTSGIIRSLTGGVVSHHFLFFHFSPLFLKTVPVIISLFVHIPAFPNKFYIYQPTRVTGDMFSVPPAPQLERYTFNCTGTVSCSISFVWNSLFTRHDTEYIARP